MRTKLTGICTVYVCIALSSFTENGISDYIIHPEGTTISTRFHTPQGFARLTYKQSSFEYYLSHFPVKPIDAKVHYYNGQVKPRRDTYASVLDIDVGNPDLQQCADAVMRLRAEYLFQQKRYHDIHFNFTNGFRSDYSKWAEGYRIKFAGNNTSWLKTSIRDYSYNTFKAYLNIVFSYAGTLSLSKELIKRISVI